MDKYLSKALWLLAIPAVFFLQSCEQEDVVNAAEVEAFVEEAVYEVQESAGCGKMGCFEFVFPISITYPDGSTAELNSYDELKSSIQTWKEDNPDAEERPSLNFPVDVVDDEGNVTTVESREDLRELRRACGKHKFGRGPRGIFGRGTHCFTLVFPLTVDFPDGSSAEYASREEMKEALHAWKQDNRGSGERPALAFPITVELEDGSQTSVDSKEALKELKSSCQDS